MAQQKYSIDVDGSDVMSKVLLDLLNGYPALGGRTITFSTLGDTSGLAFFPSSGAAILTDKDDVTGHVTQVCLYPFTIVFRAAPKSEGQRLKIKEFLDTIGKWTEQQPIVIDGETLQLTDYPDLSTEGREIKSIRRTNPAHLAATYQDGIEDWTLAANLKYENSFDR
jgi:hypothetical protein